ncbi:MAG: hypothetical protein AAGD33_02260 [Actinomycetota bacterium]
MAAGDALVFVDCLRHGGASRTASEGERRMMIIRYGPTWAKSRYGYGWSEDLLARLSPARRSVLEPVPPIRPGEPRIPVEAPLLAAESDD